MATFSNRSNGAERSSLAETKEGLNADPIRALFYRFPNGRMVKREFVCGDVHGNPGESFKFHVDKLLGNEWSSENPLGRGFNGVYDVYVASFDGDQRKAMALGAEFCGIEETARPAPASGTASARRKVDAAWIELEPTPSTPAPNFRKLWPGAFKQAWPYRGQAGNLLFYVARYERPGKKKGEVSKETPAITFGHTGNGRAYWRAKGGRHMLYGLETLAGADGAEVWIFEGEKTAEAARQLFPDVLCLTWRGGASAIRKIDLSPLAGRRARFVADRDDNGAGEKAMRIGAELALKAGALAVAVVTMPETFADGWDVADRLPSGWTVEMIRAHIEAAEWRGSPPPPPPRGTKAGVEPYWRAIGNRPVAEVREELAEVIADRGSVAARGIPGLGKTTAEQQRAKGEEGWVLFMEPNHAIAKQVASDMGRFAHHLAGRAWEYAPGQTMCAIPEDAEAAHMAGLNVRQELCKYCPHKLGCKYLDQLDHIDSAMQSKPAGAVVTVHQYYTQTMPREIDAEMIDRVVIDERLDLDRETAVPLDRLTEEAFNVLFGQRIADAFNEEGYLDLTGFTAKELEEQADKEALHVKLKLDPNWSFEERRAAIRKHAEQRRQEFRWRFARLYRVMSWEIAAKRAVSNQVVLKRKEADRNGGDRRDIIHVHERRDPSEELAHLPTHYIDGTLDKIHAQALLGADARFVTLDAKRNLHVTQVCDSLFSKHRLLYRDQSARYRQELYWFLLALGAKHRTILVGAPLAIREVMEAEWQAFSAKIKGAPTVSFLHMNAGRGVNDFKAYDACVVIGREEPGPRAIEALARMRRPDMTITPLPGDVTSVPKWPTRLQGYTLKDGRKIGVEVSYHPDPLCQSVLEQIREGEIVQLIDRLRGVNRQEPPAVYLLTSIPTEIAVDRLVPWRELLAEVRGTTWHREAMKAGGGVAPLRADWLVSKGIFETEAAARRAVSRFLADNDGATVVPFRTADQKHGRDSVALLAPGIAAPAEMLARHVGVLSEYDGEKVPEPEAAAFEPDEAEIEEVRAELDTEDGMRRVMSVIYGGLSGWKAHAGEMEAPEESPEVIGNFPSEIALHLHRLC